MVNDHGERSGAEENGGRGYIFLYLKKNLMCVKIVTDLSKNRINGEKK